MKKIGCIGFGLTLCAGLAGCGNQGKVGIFWPVFLLLLGLVLLVLSILQTNSVLRYRKRMRKRCLSRRQPRGLGGITYGFYGSAAVLLLLALLLFCVGGAENPDSGLARNHQETGNSTANTTDKTKPAAAFEPGKTVSSDPSKWGITWEVYQNGSLVSDYSRTTPISFGEPEEYFSLPGISTFRGNNYRDSATYGTGNVVEKTISPAWSTSTGSLAIKGGGSWTGSGWTGQPLVVQWDEATRSVMNLYQEKENKANLVEVIYATLDGRIYFLDLEDGSYTRDPVNVGLCFKGSGTLDPRGYPLLYVGAGDTDIDGKRPRMFIISLIDGSILYEYGHEETLSLRQDNDRWCAFDSAPLIHAESDTLIWPGENGLLYTIKLNTDYNQAAGTISVSPEMPVLARYNTSRSGQDSYWYGYEASVNIVENYLYVSENGGMFFCVDLNTMELVWAQDTKDDSNSTPVFQRLAEDAGFIYTAPSLHWTADENAAGTIAIYKLDAVTGQILWQKPYDVNTVEGVSGGVQSSPLLGKAGTSLEGLILYTIARTPDVNNGLLVALDTETGNEVWRMAMDNYAWSSPVAVYGQDGSAYVVVCDSVGNVFFLDGASGTLLDSTSVGYLVEASPVVYKNMLVVGTRGQQIYGLEVE